MKACIKCHTPLGFRSHSISSPEEDFDKLAPLPAQGIFCNWCHNIKEVKHIGNAAVAGDTNAKMAIERLKNAADLEIIKDGSYIAGQPAQIKVKVINSGAGHYLPTGVTEIREMWLTLKVKDASGKIIFSSGDLDKEENLDKNTVLYNTQFGDKKGNPTENLALADRVLRDYRIPPKGHRIESFSFNIPPGAKSPLEIETTLKYRSISPALAKKLLGEKSPEIPIIDMVSATEKIIVKD